MADVKISGLPASTVPLAGTEVLPIVQGGATKQVANNDLRPKQVQSNATSGILQVAGPGAAATRVMTTPDANFTVARIDAAQSFAGNQTLTDGNLIVGTSGKGVDFSATPGTGTSELLADYEEGTWTPLMSANGAGSDVWTSSTALGKYTKIGRLVSIECIYTYTAKQSATGSYAWMTGLPFTPSSNNGFFYVAINSGGGADTATYAGQIAPSAFISFVKDQNQSGAGAMLGSDFPAATKTITFQAMYVV
jgi:hypothetical protein